MRPCALLPLLALLARAAPLPVSRQLHSADFSTPGPPPKGPITNPLDAETGSRRADIASNGMFVSRLVDQDPSARLAAISVPAQLSASDGVLAGSVANLVYNLLPPGLLERMASADSPVNLPTVAAASGNHLASRLLGSALGSTTGAVALNSNSAQPQASPDILHAVQSNHLFPRDANPDTPALPVTPSLPSLPSLPLPSLPSPPIRRDIGSASPPATERRARFVADKLRRQTLPISLPPLPNIPPTKRQALDLPVKLPIPLPSAPPLPRDASAPTVHSGLLSASVPRDSFVVREERL